MSNLSKYNITREETGTLQMIQMKCYGQAKAMGWHDCNVDELVNKWIEEKSINGYVDVSKAYELIKLIHENKPRDTATLLALIHSEISEALEGDRKNLPDDHLPHRRMIEVELADAIIRIFDLAGRERLDVAGALKEKLEYNQQRADHKKENREQDNGKSY